MESKLKEVREGKGLTQIKLAREAGVSVQWIAKIEQGWDSGVSEKTRKKISIALGVSEEEIFPEVRKEKEAILFETYKRDRDLYRKLRRVITAEEKFWLLEFNGDYLAYRKRLHKLQKKYGIDIPTSLKNGKTTKD